jgi:hypothetical protein
MLAAIIPVGEQAWFFKAMGPVEQVAPLQESFDQLLQSVQFASPSDNPTWQLPTGWQERPANMFRHATLVAANGIEVTVSKLGLPANQELEPYLLSNVNRWREQLNLPAVDASKFSTTTEPMQVAGRDAIKVDLTGMAPTGGPPMMRGAPGVGGTAATPGSGTENRSQSKPEAQASGQGIGPATTSPPGESQKSLAAVPEHWTQGPTTAFRIAAYTVNRDDLKAEVTAIPLGPAAGSDLENVNRWRGEIGLPPIAQTEMEAQLQPIEVAEKSGKLVEILDAPEEPGAEATLAVIVPLEGQTLFLKMRGDQTLVTEERKNFRDFAESFQMPSGR